MSQSHTFVHHTYVHEGEDRFCLLHKWKLQHQLTSPYYTLMTTVAILLLLSEAAVSQLTHTQYTRKVGVKKFV